MRHAPFVLAALMLSLSLGHLALAQPMPSSRVDAGVAHTGMGQGTASITARSDVRMALESGAATPSDRLEAIGDAVRGKIADIRTCYGRVSAAHPEFVASMRIRIALPASGAPTVEGPADSTIQVPDPIRDRMTADAYADLFRQLRTCSVRALRSAALARLARPATAFVSLEFTNTAARGASEEIHRHQEQARSDTSTTPEGRTRASGQTAEGDVQFTVTGAATTDAAVTGAFGRSLRAGIGAFLDCRRRAGRRGRSPAGEIVLHVAIGAHGGPRATALTSTVGDTAAPRCVTTGLSHLRLDDGARPGEWEMVLVFSGAGVAAIAATPPTGSTGPRPPRRHP